MIPRDQYFWLNMEFCSNVFVGDTLICIIPWDPCLYVVYTFQNTYILSFGFRRIRNGVPMNQLFRKRNHRWLSAKPLVVVGRVLVSNLDMLSHCALISAHILSKVDTEIRWHFLSTCHIMRLCNNQILLLCIVAVMDLVYLATSMPFWPSTSVQCMRSGH